ncbi:hypothetical protein [Marinobacter sp. M5B]|uniref:hypothetical protein n=1 Tax=Marinobacter sp. M5B TaxID=3141535 RepID=UPI0036D25C03
MTFNPTIALLLFIASVAVGALLIYLKIHLGYRRPDQQDSINAPVPTDERLILSSEGFQVYRPESPAPGESPVYYLNVDDRIIIDIRDASADRYASIRCVIPQKVLQNLAAAVLSDLDEGGTQV